MSGREKERPKVAATTLGQPKTVEANGSPFIADPGETCKQGCGVARWRSRTSWRYGYWRGGRRRGPFSRHGRLIIQAENRQVAA
jgi:hypothetical protein